MNSQWSHVAERRPVAAAGYDSCRCGGFTGSASLAIDLDGFPGGTRTASRADGLFKQVTLNRGRPMGSRERDPADRAARGRHFNHATLTLPHGRRVEAPATTITLRESLATAN